MAPLSNKALEEAKRRTAPINNTFFPLGNLARIPTRPQQVVTNSRKIWESSTPKPFEKSFESRPRKESPEKKPKLQQPSNVQKSISKIQVPQFNINYYLNGDKVENGN